MQFQTNKKHSSTSVHSSKTIATTSMFATLALIFSYIEAILPFSLGIPGVKLGLANFVIIVALYKMNFKYAFFINLIRITISGLLFSGVFGMFYSLSGGLLSLLIMYLLKRTQMFSMVGVSMAGGVAHNLGQLLTASLIVSNFKMFFYFPVLMFSGLLTGILIGILSYIISDKIPKKLFQ